MVSNKLSAYSFICVIPVLLGITLPGQAQFIHFSLQIESELQAVTLRSLSFGTVQQNSGAVNVSLDHENAGIFAITGNPEHIVMVNLEFPDKLYHEERSVSDTIPISIKAAYANRGKERVEDAQLFTHNTASFRMFEGKTKLTEHSILSDVTAYIYVFGGIQVGHIETGIYNGEVILQVEYL